MSRKKCLSMFVAVFVPMIILSLSMTEIIHTTKIKFTSDLTRDLAQLIYFSMAVLGLLGCRTDVQINHRFYCIRLRFSLDSITIFTVALCCLIMSSKFISKVLGDQIMMVIDIIGNGAGFIYILMIFSKRGF
jgi:hypothetical protein